MSLMPGLPLLSDDGIVPVAQPLAEWHLVAGQLEALPYVAAGCRTKRIASAVSPHFDASRWRVGLHPDMKIERICNHERVRWNDECRWLMQIHMVKFGK